MSRAAWRTRKRGSLICRVRFGERFEDRSLKRTLPLSPLHFLLCGHCPEFAVLSVCGFLDDQNAVPDLFFQFDSVRGKIGEPLSIGEISETIFAGAEAYFGGPPALAVGTHGDGLGLPLGEISSDGDSLCIGTKKAKLHFSIRSYACHRMTPFGMM